MMGKAMKISGLSAAGLALVGGAVYFSMTGIDAEEVDMNAQEEKISEYANPDAFVSPRQLQDMMDSDEDVVVIGTMDERGGAIPGSFEVWRPDYSGTDAYEYDGMANSKEEVEELMSSFGVTEDTTVVTYAANAQHDSARLFWQLEMLGHEDVRFLDGGINAWKGAGFDTGDPLEAGDVEETNYAAPDFNEEGFNADLDHMLAAAADDSVIIDTRDPEEEEGSTTVTGAFGPGKIAGAEYINWTEAVAEDGTAVTADELEDLYGTYTDSGETIIPYCQSGVRSSYTWLLLTHGMGYDNALNYDGSWIEWSYQAYEQGDENVINLTENGDF
ncbi:thiosulfate/3-mercaptopyruvate sulfurtransferase [Salisediminibacterium halotolerans]|uniref:Sulfurtransferase n=2 Tax=Salisediminibacterium halotolerans TaxID=517425 RepID=A0A1H9UED9_9BACI|nr:thiosulfate/3-mercaptopyruvate sulfurtransferase [Salisediminibacterium haloalkalitolerans]